MGGSLLTPGRAGQPLLRRRYRPLLSVIRNRGSGYSSQEVCPFNVRFSELAAEPGYAARGPGERPVGVEGASAETQGRKDVRTGTPGSPAHPGTDGPPLTELLAMALSEEAWESFSRGSAIRRAGRAGFARNASVALGNWLSSVEHPPEEAVAVLGRALLDPEPLVRGHAAWAPGSGGVESGSGGSRVTVRTRARSLGEGGARPGPGPVRTSRAAWLQRTSGHERVRSE